MRNVIILVHPQILTVISTSVKFQSFACNVTRRVVRVILAWQSMDNYTTLHVALLPLRFKQLLKLGGVLCSEKVRGMGL